MNILALVLAGWQGLIFKIAIACVIAWGIWELIKWAGWPIPQPIRILAIVLFSILLIYWLFELFNILIS